MYTRLRLPVEFYCVDFYGEQQRLCWELDKRRLQKMRKILMHCLQGDIPVETVKLGYVGVGGGYSYEVVFSPLGDTIVPGFENMIRFGQMCASVKNKLYMTVDQAERLIKQIDSVTL